MSFLSRHALQLISSWAELLAVVLTLAGAFSGVLFVAASRPLRKAEAAEKAELQSKLVTTKASAELAHLRAAELEATISPRRLTDEQIGKLSALSTFAGRQVDVQSYSNDTEALVLATQIGAALRQAHIAVLDNRSTVVAAGVPAFGILVDGTDRQLIAALRDIFGELNGTPAPFTGTVTLVSYGHRGTNRPSSAVLTVGTKPLRAIP